MPCHASPAPDPACPCRRAACPSHTLPSPRPALRHLAPPLRRPCPAMPRRRAAVPTRASPAPVHAQPCPSPFIACPGHRHADLRPASAIRDLALACHRSSMLRQRLAQHTIASPSLYLASSRRTVPCRCESSPCCAAPMRYFAPPMPCFVLPCLRHPARGPAPRRRARRRAAAPPLRLSTRSLAHRHADLRPASAIRPALRQRSPAHSHRLTGRRAAAFATLCSAVAMLFCATPSLRYTTMYHAPPPLIPSALCLGCSSLGHANALPCGTLRRPRVALLRPRRTLPDQANALLCGTWHRPGEAAPCPRYAIAHQRLSSLRQYPTCLRFALAQPCFAPSWLYFTVQRPRVPQPRHRFTIRALPRLRYALLRRSVAAPVLASPLLVLASPTAAIAIHRFA